MSTAVLIEPRCHPALGFVLRNLHENIPVHWKILVFHGMNNRERVHSLLNTLPTERWMPPIELEIDNLTREMYNGLLMSPDFYDAIPTEHHLIVQTDAILFAEHRHFLPLFLSYDYVGAPWKNGWVGNGGLSLRRTRQMKAICEQVTPADAVTDIFQLVSEQHAPSPMLEGISWAEWVEQCKQNLSFASEINEDLYFSYQQRIRLHKPPASLARYFAVESVFCDTTWGTHAPWKNLSPSELHALRTRYPELNEYMRQFIDESTSERPENTR